MIDIFRLSDDEIADWINSGSGIADSAFSVGTGTGVRTQEHTYSISDRRKIVYQSFQGIGGPGSASVIAPVSLGTQVQYYIGYISHRAWVSAPVADLDLFVVTAIAAASNTTYQKTCSQNVGGIALGAITILDESPPMPILFRSLTAFNSGAANVNYSFNFTGLQVFVQGS